MKPENIILEGGRPGGRVYLVDFGGVQVHYKCAQGNLLRFAYDTGIRAICRTMRMPGLPMAVRGARRMQLPVWQA